MSDEIEVSPSNERGHWERSELTAFHDRVMGLFGRDWYDPKHVLSLPPRWWKERAVVTIRDEMEQWLAERRNALRSFGFKDPRVARLLPLWDDICANLRLDPRYIFCARDPAQVARSVAARDAIALRESEYRWMVYNSHGIHDLADRPVCIVPYETWFTDPGANLARIAAHLDLEWATGNSVVEQLVGRTLDPNLRHDSEDGAALAAGLPLELHRHIVESASIGRFGQGARDTAAAFIAFEEFVQPLLGERPDRFPESPGASSSLEPSGRLQYPDSDVQLAEGLITTIHHYSEALRSVLGEIRQRSAPAQQTDAPHSPQSDAAQ